MISVWQSPLKFYYNIDTKRKPELDMGTTTLGKTETFKKRGSRKYDR